MPRRLPAVLQVDANLGPRTDVVDGIQLHRSQQHVGEGLSINQHVLVMIAVEVADRLRLRQILTLEAALDARGPQDVVVAARVDVQRCARSIHVESRRGQRELEFFSIHGQRRSERDLREAAAEEDVRAAPERIDQSEVATPIAVQITESHEATEIRQRHVG